jgi:molybdopterin converting factor small subunit
MRAIVNGKLVDLPQGTTVEELRKKLPEIGLYLKLSREKAILD